MPKVTEHEGLIQLDIQLFDKKAVGFVYWVFQMSFRFKRLPPGHFSLI